MMNYDSFWLKLQAACAHVLIKKDVNLNEIK